jgi:hypothetical protein
MTQPERVVRGCKPLVVLYRNTIKLQGVPKAQATAHTLKGVLGTGGNAPGTVRMPEMLQWIICSQTLPGLTVLRVQFND